MALDESSDVGTPDPDAEADRDDGPTLFAAAREIGLPRIAACAAGVLVVLAALIGFAR